MAIRGSLLCVLLGTAILMGACHDGEDHPWPMWEMKIPYSTKVTGGYPMMGVLTRYESLGECRAMRTKVIRNLEQSTPRDELITLVKGRTWCLPAWPDTRNWDRIDLGSEGIVWTMKDTAHNQKRMEKWRRTE